MTTISYSLKFSERILLQRRFAFSSSAANGQSFKKKYSWLEDLGSCRYAISSADFIFDRWHFSSFFSSNFRFDFFFDLLSIFKLPYICYYCFLLLLIPLTCILQVNLYHYYFIQASGMNWNNHYTIIISTNAVSTLRGACSLSFFFFFQLYVEACLIHILQNYTKGKFTDKTS